MRSAIFTQPSPPPPPPPLADAVGDLHVAFRGAARGGAALARGSADVAADQVRHLERPHRIPMLAFSFLTPMPLPPFGALTVVRCSPSEPTASTGRSLPSGSASDRPAAS